MQIPVLGVCVPVSIFPSRAAGPSRTRLLICRNSSGSSPPTTVNPKPRRLFFSLVLMKVPFSSAGLRVKKGLPPEEAWAQTHTRITNYECPLCTLKWYDLSRGHRMKRDGVGRRVWVFWEAGVGVACRTGL